MILQPGNVFVIENSPTEVEWFQAAVVTARIRGRVDVLFDALPSGEVRMHGNTPVFPERVTPKAHYRLTEGGSSVIHRTHAWTVATFLVSFLALLASIVAVVVTWPK